MKHVPRVRNESLEPSLQAWVHARREVRNFVPELWVESKLFLLGKYFTEHKIKVALVAISGGIDSAVTLGLMSRLRGVTTIAVTLPAHDEIGATRQDETERLAHKLGEAFNVNIFTFGIHDSVAVIQDGITECTTLKSTNWSRGQSVAYTRTAALYSLTAALADKYRTVLVGTTNRDEGSYLGYIGKASDGMVDLQPISDLHKSDVYATAAYLGVPEEILNAVPTGDMFDGRTDEEVFGAPYDFVELYTSLLKQYGEPSKEALEAEEHIFGLQFSYAAKTQFFKYAMAIEELHKYNRHKYIGASPAVHFDLQPFVVPDGWITNCGDDAAREPRKAPPHPEKHLDLISIASSSVATTAEITKRVLPGGGVVLHFRDILSMEACEYLTQVVNHNDQSWIRADEHGRPTAADYYSQRRGLNSVDLAQFIYDRISPNLYPIYHNEQLDNDLLEGWPVWSRYGLNPYFRAIKYEQGGWLVPHYDDTFKLDSARKSLMSVVVYLTEGETRFLRENRALHSYEDQNEPPANHRVLETIKCKPGDVLIFDHRVLHDCAPTMDSKMILRSDLMFERPQLGRAIRQK